MLAIRAKYDGENIHIPRNIKHVPPCNVIVLFEDKESSDKADWLKLQEQAIEKTWDNKEDSIYDQV